MKKYIPKNDSDDLNPRYLFQGIATDLLVAIVNKLMIILMFGIINHTKNVGLFWCHHLPVKSGMMNWWK